MSFNKFSCVAAILIMVGCNTTKRSDSDASGLNTVPPAPNVLIYRFKQPFSAGVTKTKNWQEIAKVADSNTAGVCAVSIYEDTLVANGPTTAHISIVFENNGSMLKAGEQLEKVLDMSQMSSAAGGAVKCSVTAQSFASRAAAKLYIAMKGKSTEGEKTRSLASLNCRSGLGCTAVKSSSEIAHHTKANGKALLDAMKAVWLEQKIPGDATNMAATDLVCTEKYHPGQEPMTEWSCKFKTQPQ